MNHVFYPVFLHRPLFFITALLFLLCNAGCGGSTATRGEAAQSTLQPRSAPSVVAKTAPVPVEPAQAKAALAADSPAKAAQVAAAKPTAAARVSTALAQGGSEALQGEVAECWQPLVKRLSDDPKVSPEMIRYFCALPEYSPAPMGTKVKELFTNAFMRKPRKDRDKDAPVRPRIYRHMVTRAALDNCRDFMALHKDSLEAVEKKHPLPKEILVALLYVETRLGAYVGKKNAFWSLACLASADKPERVRGGLGDIPISEKHDSWLQTRLTDKSDWAYKELRSYLAFCSTQNLDPGVMPGSVYGAIGICQFMPSNLLPYGEDGDGDGVVNLFSVPDAIFSAAKYLSAHGWKKDMPVAGQRTVLKRYNNLTIYANTILALAESLRTGKLQTGPPDEPLVAKR